MVSLRLGHLTLWRTSDFGKPAIFKGRPDRHGAKELNMKKSRLRFISALPQLVAERAG
jgi:hypothetical protein